jgi:hypothetical protein
MQQFPGHHCRQSNVDDQLTARVTQGISAILIRAMQQIATGDNFWNSRVGRVFWGLRVVPFGLKYGWMCEMDAR